METVGNAMLIISTATLLYPFVCLFFALLDSMGEKQDAQALNIQEALDRLEAAHQFADAGKMVDELDEALDRLEGGAEK